MSDTGDDAAARLGAMATGHAVVTMLALGHRLGLLEPLAERACSVDELAGGTGAAPRYLREWLSALVAGGVVAVDGDRFRLREDYRPLLTGASAANTAPTLDMMARLAENVPEIARRFGDGRGIPPASFAARAGGDLGAPRRHLYDEHFVDGFLGAVPGLHDRLRAGAAVLDLGCGTGRTSRLVAEAFPACRVLGVDVVADVVAAARREHADVAGVEFALGDATGRHGRFDVVLAVDVVHDLPEPAAALRAVHDSLAEDGILVMVDTAFSSEIRDHVDDPVAAAAAATSVLYCLPISLHHEHGAGAGLGALWGHQTAEAMLREAGFTDVERHPAPRPQNVVYAASPSPT